MKTAFVLFATAILALQSAPAAPAPLGPDILEKIDQMEPIFDGHSLAGWIAAPPYPTTLSGSDVTDMAGLAHDLASGSNPVAAFLASQLSPAAEAAAGSYSQASAKSATSLVLKELNRILSGPSVYTAGRFEGVRLRPETEALLRRNPSGQDLVRLNRMLIEDAFPSRLAPSPLVSWTVKDGALASTGGGRGVLYTERDFGHYRLIFKMRHVSGKPDHQPCFLVFCVRPQPGEKGLDALGGIQFQVPNGGHWDYRPGHNNGGTSFTIPTKTKYDNHEWSQVEIVVNAKTGVARMAVAQPVGTRGVENLDFREAAAGRVGPIALQMHNAGLFDEYKDVRIEVDPSDDRLITAE